MRIADTVRDLIRDIHDTDDVEAATELEAALECTIERLEERAARTVFASAANRLLRRADRYRNLLEHLTRLGETL